MIFHIILSVAGVLLGASAFAYAEEQNLRVLEIGDHYIFVIIYLLLSLPCYLVLGRRLIKLYWVVPDIFAIWYNTRGSGA
jgi:hypothetical protein